jgi:hypothetical protein
VSELRKEIQKLQKKVQMEAQAKARNRADQQKGMIQLPQKMIAASSNVRKSVSTGKLVGKTGQGRLIVMVKMKEVAMKMAATIRKTTHCVPKTSGLQHSGQIVCPECKKQPHDIASKNINPGSNPFYY